MKSLCAARLRLCVHYLRICRQNYQLADSGHAGCLQEKQRQRQQVAALRASLAPGAAAAVRPPWSGPVKAASLRPLPARPAGAGASPERELLMGLAGRSGQPAGLRAYRSDELSNYRVKMMLQAP